ncbi:MAG: hypothetical protein HZC49_10260 [Nitrospirae bacterium]|nr:hypothetical protein [Nitrospirota bacterium]
MDKLDKLSLVFILIFIAAVAVVSAEYRSASGKDVSRSSTGPGAAAETAGISGGQMNILNNLIETNNLQKAEALLKELIGKYPYEGSLHMLMGDVMMRKQDAVGAVFKYREAVDLEPDYLDKKTPLFQGHKIKVAVEEAKAEINETPSGKPGAHDMKSAKKEVYYLLRKLAGSCG